MVESSEESLSSSFEDQGEQLIALEKRSHLGRYELCYELGSGGMASVYLARMRGPQGFAKAVAIKRIHPHLTRKESIVSMFLDEAQIASSIDHPNVCAVFDFGQVDGSYFIAMEYLVGDSLAMLLRRVRKNLDLLGSLRWQRVLAHIIADVGRGLHAAHELRDETGQPLSIVHRDVTPHNIFVTYDGATKLTDFGVAWATQRITQTTAGALKGKFAYMSPEQIRRQPFDRRADLWALGVCLWEGLTGRRLFRKNADVDTLMAIERAPIRPPSELIKTVPPELDAIVLKALSRDTEERYASAREMTRELRRFLSEGELIDMVDVAELVGELSEAKREKLDVVQEMMTVATNSGVSLRGAPAPPISSQRPLPPSTPPISSQHPLPPSTPPISSQHPLPSSIPPLASPAGISSPAPFPTATLDTEKEAATGDRRRLLVALFAGTFLITAAAIPLVLMLSGRSDPSEASAREPGQTGQTGRTGQTGQTDLREAAQAPTVVHGGDDEASGERASSSEEGDAIPDRAEEAARNEEGSHEGAGPEDPSADGPTEGENGAEEQSSPAGTERRRAARLRRLRRERARQSRERAMQAEEPRATEQAQEGGEGRVNVVTTGGWGEVENNGRWIQAPTRLTLPAGRHRIRARDPRSGRVVSRTVQVASGETTRLAIPLR